MLASYSIDSYISIGLTHNNKLIPEDLIKELVLNLSSVVKFCFNGLTVTSKHFNIFVDLMAMKSSVLVSVKTEAHSFIHGLITAEQWPSDLLHSSHELQA